MLYTGGMDPIIPAAVFFAALLLSAGATRWLIRYLNRLNVMDIPNARSNHKAPVPRGGGIAPVAIILAGWGALTMGHESMPPVLSFQEFVLVGGAVLLLAGISFFDDLKGLSPLARLVAQFAATGVVVIALPFDGAVFQGFVPGWLDAIFTVILWVWFINLYNFMDGIDGIAGIETAAIGLGIAVALYMSGGFTDQTAAHGLMGLLVAGAAIGFLFFNWSPAKVLLGDAGSVPLGFMLGWLLLELAASGQWAAALILPSYYLVDATLTLLRRGIRGEAVWRAHKEHFYQQAVAKGLSHARVSTTLAIGNIFLIALAITSAHAPVSGLISAAAVVFVLLLYFKQSQLRPERE